MFGLSASHILIFGVLILLFGSKRLPEVGAGIGKGIKSFKDAMDGKVPEQVSLVTHERDAAETMKKS